MAQEKRILGGFQIDKKLLEAAEKLAEESDRSRSAVIRIALREYVERKTVLRKSSNGQQAQS